MGYGSLEDIEFLSFSSLLKDSIHICTHIHTYIMCILYFMVFPLYYKILSISPFPYSWTLFICFIGISLHLVYFTGSSLYLLILSS